MFAEVSSGRSSLSGTSLQSDTNPAKELALSGDGLKLLKDIETLRLKPYDDQTGKESKYPPAKPGALCCEPLKAVNRVANAAL
ncbi:hypothetical protein ACQE3E_01655 [Methylomonas sp. MED-D]|uniref:hypothetical protein n=1 Tax=unclassified Methylomonas TaxID=2608980 RepID=UPI0028A543F6|nr:hypothetical protein [Methylomonas sp. MV1]MDT4330384.1 hypothetical protein [Methylomonas sp. MV1]